VSFDTKKIRGSHGNTGPGFEIAWTSSLPLDPAPKTFLDLARATEAWMNAR
jgi:hypothetical protein